MNQQEFIVERDRRAKEKWEEVIKVTKHLTEPGEQLGAIVQYLLKDIAACQMMIEEIKK